MGLTVPVVKRQHSESPEMPAELRLPSIPVPIKDFIPHFAKNKSVPVPEILEPFKAYESKLRRFYAQKPDASALKDGLTNMVPIFGGHGSDLKIRARNLDEETEEEQGKYVMPLLDAERKPDGAPAVVASLKDFQKNFNIFSESSLAELDWSNVVAAGSSVTTALLPVPEKWNGSKRSLREYYHEKLAPASDVDLFLYGLTEEEGLQKIKQIESNIRDSILHEVTTIRTKNAITIVSQYPTRHVQIVLRLYDSISQIITGFDVDCSCAAYDGKQVWASPRALAAFATQINTVDLTRRSPSYENRLSKYSHRGFEVYWEGLDRSRVDPTIFERSFARTLGLARLLVLEKLPKAYHRERYADKRREERGRPAINRDFRMNAMHSGNLKQQEEDEVAEWVEEDQVSDYNTMVVPYGKKFTAAKILRLLYSKDLLLNSEWNKPKDREVNLHRHPCFFGTAEEVLQDCCGYCPEPKTEEEKEIVEQESRLYISGALEFIKDDPGRQEVGSFNPITTDDWTEMGYVGNTQMLCQAVVDGDLEYIRSWLEQEGNNPDTRDYVGRTPLHLAAINGSTEVVKLLVEGGAKLIYRLLDGRSALHIASQLGHADIVEILMDKSLENEEEENEKADKKARKLRAAKAAAARAKAAAAAKERDGSPESDDVDMVNDEDVSESETLGDEDTDSDEKSDNDSETQGFTKVEKEEPEASNAIPEDNEDEPDFYDINAPAWDLQCAPLHFAIMGGHIPVIRMLVEDYGADIHRPIKLAKTAIWDTQNKAILPLVLATFAPEEKVQDVVQTLLKLGATTAQADISHFTALHYIVEYNKLDIIDLMLKHDGPAAKSAINVIPLGDDQRPRTALSLALLKRHEMVASKLLGLGAKAFVSYDDWVQPYFRKNEHARTQAHDQNFKKFTTSCPQPIISAAAKELPKIVKQMVENGADVNTLTLRGQQVAVGQHNNHTGRSLLDIVQHQIKKYAEFDAFKEKMLNRWERKNESVAPETLRDEAHYLECLKPGSYQYWTAKNRFRSVKAFNAQLWANYDAQTKKGNEHVEEKKAKNEKAKLIKQELQELEKLLIEKGAKTFKELHPDIQEPQNHNHDREYQYPKDLDFEEYKTTFTFNRPTLSDNEKEGYMRLFEAAWKNEIVEVKALTLAEWTSEDGKKNEPLHVAVQDCIEHDYNHYDGYSGKPPPKKRYEFTGMNPLAVAVLNGHQQLAKVIMEIALAQYEKPDSEKKPSERAKKSQWRLEIVDKDNEDYDSDNEDGDVRFASTIVDDVYTIDNVAAIAKVTKSPVEPYQMLEWSCNAPWSNSEYDTNAVKEHKKAAEEYALNQDFLHPWLRFNSGTLVEHCIATDDLPLLRSLWDLCPEKHDGCKEPITAACLCAGYFNDAMEQGRTAIMAAMIRHLGPHVDDLVTTAPGVVVKDEIPRYYQGLDVGGKKNKAWADEANPDRQNDYISDFSRESSLLIRAIKYGNLESVQWFLTDLPLQEYLRYAESHTEYENVKSLSEAPGGFKKAISDWLGLRKDLLLHAYLLTKRDSADDAPLLAYLLTTFPHLLDKRSIGGLTPLHIAIKTQSAQTIAALLSAGANPRAKDGNGYNALHYLFKTHASYCVHKFHFSQEKDFLKERLRLFRREDVKEMLMEPSREGELCRHFLMVDWRNVLRPHLLIEQYIGGADLVLRNSAGDFPLHCAVKCNSVALVGHLLEVEPRVLNWENASGVSAWEIAEGRQAALVVRGWEGLGRGGYGWEEWSETMGLVIEQMEGWERPVEMQQEFGEGTDREKTERVWEAVRRVREELEGSGEWKRRLVTLGEANEVAKGIEDGRADGLRAFAQVEVGQKREKVKWDETAGMAI